MTVAEMIKALKAYPKDARVYVVNDWEVVNENGELTDISEVEDFVSQRVVVDMGLDFVDEQQVLIEL